MGNNSFSPDYRQPIQPLGSQSSPKPRVTSSNSPEYCYRLAEITSRACLLDPFNILLQRESTGTSTPVSLEGLFKAAMKRVETKIALGCSVAEADNFAAVACWEPPSATLSDLTTTQLDEMAKEKPIYAQFIREYQAARVECLGEGQRYWKLSLMARDPERISKGAVRAIIEPYIMRAKIEGIPIWLVAGNEHARDVYAYFGFRVVKFIWSRQDNLAVLTWCMVCNWPPESNSPKLA